MIEQDKVMTSNKIDFDYTQGKKPFRDIIWINIRTGKKELIKIPLAKTMREVPLIKYHVSELLYNYWKEMGSCDTEGLRELID